MRFVQKMLKSLVKSREKCVLYGKCLAPTEHHDTCWNFSNLKGCVTLSAPIPSVQKMLEKPCETCIENILYGGGLSPTKCRDTCWVKVKKLSACQCVLLQKLLQSMVKHNHFVYGGGFPQWNTTTHVGTVSVPIMCFKNL